ncbi:hypothetical protein JMG10_28265 [Nostoc ellipsosporum NOK]|nr:hypothetical protein [Nostoc ellipsosporum NOK]
MRYSYLLISLLMMFGCGQASVESAQEKLPAADQGPAFTADKKSPQLNITLLLDLSDRIDPAKNAALHYERDTALIGYFIDMFLNEIRVKGAYLAKGKFRVMFEPAPPISEVEKIVRELNVDLAAANGPAAKKEVYKTFRSKAMRHIATLYNAAIKNGKWPGADTWGFFKRGSDLTIDADPAYRNILVVFSDGYLVEKSQKFSDRNRYTYLTASLLQKYKLRDNPKWMQQIEQSDFGLLAPPVNLSTLEVLLLEMNPSKQYPHEEDILRYVLGKWFREMKVKRSLISMTDYPGNTVTRIQKFLNSK